MSIHANPSTSSGRTEKVLNAPIGVFDSGIGGLSVLRVMCAALPNERFVYFADTANAPYGEKDAEFVIDRSQAIAQKIRDEHSIKALVVACNTATAAAIAELRIAHPDLIIIGIEPALKPAAAISASKHVAVFATQGTLASNKFKLLLAQQSQFASVQFTCIACVGLAETIERHSSDLNHLDIATKVQQFAALCPPQADTVVLGCTHYPLVESVFKTYLSAHVRIVSNGQAVAKQLATRLNDARLLQTAPPESFTPVTPSSTFDAAQAVELTSSSNESNVNVPLAALWAAVKIV